METVIDTGDTAWILTATVLVTMMTPALGFFYGGMVRKKNLLSTLNLSFITMGLIGVQWVLYGYTLAFGPTQGGWIGAGAWIIWEESRALTLPAGVTLLDRRSYGDTVVTILRPEA